MIIPTRRMPVKSNSEPLLTLHDRPARWQVSRKSVCRFVARGDLKVHRIGPPHLARGRGSLREAPPQLGAAESA